MTPGTETTALTGPNDSDAGIGVLRPRGRPSCTSRTCPLFSVRPLPTEGASCRLHGTREAKS